MAAKVKMLELAEQYDDLALRLTDQARPDRILNLSGGQSWIDVRVAWTTDAAHLRVLVQRHRKPP